METKILIGILLVISLIVGIGIVFAHGNEKSESSAKTEMSNMMNSDMRMPMMGMMDNMDKMHEMMGNESSMTEMHEMMEEMMSDEELREEMLEHMKSCPMMKNLNS